MLGVDRFEASVDDEFSARSRTCSSMSSALIVERGATSVAEAAFQHHVWAPPPAVAPHASPTSASCQCRADLAVSRERHADARRLEAGARRSHGTRHAARGVLRTVHVASRSTSRRSTSTPPTATARRSPTSSPLSVVRRLVWKSIRSGCAPAMRRPWRRARHERSRRDADRPHRERGEGAPRGGRLPHAGRRPTLVNRWSRPSTCGSTASMRGRRASDVVSAQVG